MGLKCSLLGHSFEPAGTEEHREEQGSEVVTAVREMEECTRCGKTRVVSETTEVTTVVDADEVDIDEDELAGDELADDQLADDEPANEPEGGVAGAVDRSGAGDVETPDTTEAEPDDAEIIEDDEETEAASRAAAAVDELAEAPDDEESNLEERDPEEEDAEILTDDDDDDRSPGEWPDDDVDAPIEEETDIEDEADPDAEPEAELEPEDDEERLAGITVPEGEIICPECDFQIDAESSYRDGDPCPECGAWLLEDAE